MKTCVDRTDPDYEALRMSVVWNSVVPPRYPACIYSPRSGDEVSELVSQITPSLRISVRSGGHDWLGASLRDDVALLDLRHLNRVTVDHASRRATIEPGATHKRLADVLVPAGLGFPIGHCPEVGLGGYLLAGGKSWNQHAWGPGCWSVIGADVVLADGSRVFVDEDNHPELLWAARGGASGFPAIVTRFHLRLFDLPAIVGRTMSFPVGLLRELAPWVASTLGDRPPGLEMSLIARWPESGSDPVANLAVTSFARSEEAARQQLADAVNGLPTEVLADSGYRRVALNALEGDGGWVRGRRYAADTCWVDDELAELGELVANAIRRARSPLSRAVTAFPLAPDGGPDAAFTMFGPATVNFYGIWEDPAQDALHRQWVRESMDSVDHLVTGHYIGETDLLAHPSRLLRSYPLATASRLREVTAKYDPSARLCSFLGAG